MSKSSSIFAENDSRRNLLWTPRSLLNSYRQCCLPCCLISDFASIRQVFIGKRCSISPFMGLFETENGWCKLSFRSRLFPFRRSARYFLLNSREIQLLSQFCAEQFSSWPSSFDVAYDSRLSTRIIEWQRFYYKIQSSYVLFFTSDACKRVGVLWMKNIWLSSCYNKKLGIEYIYR